MNQTWPAERFYWSVLGGAGIRADKGLPSGLLAQLQEDLPVSADEVHAVGVPMSDGRLVVCAAMREELRNIDGGLLSLSPAELPPGLASGTAATDLNLLVGEFEPTSLKRERSRRRAIVALTAAALACIVSVGLVRRAQAWTKAGQEARATLSATENPLSLHTELDRLRKAPRIDPKTLSTPDAAVALASILSTWPKELECQTESVNVAPTSISLSLTVAQDARPFLSALKAPEGWSLDEPRLTATADGAKLHVVLHRKEAKS